jgi:hypothetical protein
MLHFFGQHEALNVASAFVAWLQPCRLQEWVVYAKRPFAGPQAVLAYLSRYTHRVAIANSRLIAFDERGVTFKWKDYRQQGRTRHKILTLASDEFIRRFLLHVLPHGFHRIRHYGLFANGGRAENLIQARKLLNVEIKEQPADAAEATSSSTDSTCPACGGPMIVIEMFARGQLPRAPPRIAA